MALAIPIARPDILMIEKLLLRNRFRQAILKKLLNIEQVLCFVFWGPALVIFLTFVVSLTLYVLNVVEQ
jgi:hypothetical protein